MTLCVCGISTAGDSLTILGKIETCKNIYWQGLCATQYLQVYEAELHFDSFLTLKTDHTHTQTHTNMHTHMHRKDSSNTHMLLGRVISQSLLQTATISRMRLLSR